MLVLWAASVASAQAPVFTIGGGEPQLVDGSIRLIVNNQVVGEVWTEKDGADAVEIWASTIGPESMTGGFKFEFATGPIDYDVWLDSLLDGEEERNPYDNWMEMCITYQDDAPASPAWALFGTTATRKTYDVFTREGDAGLVFTNGGLPPLRGQLQRETHAVGGVVSQWVDFWVLFEGPNPGYTAPDELGDTAWTQQAASQKTTPQFFTAWGGNANVKKYAQIGYSRATVPNAAWPYNCP